MSTKGIKRNLAYQSVYQIMLVILPLVTTPYISRILGAEGLGIYSFTFSVSSYFTTLAMLGTNNYGNRCIAQVRDDRSKLSKTFFEVFFLQILVSSVCLIAYIAYLVFFRVDHRPIAAIQAILILAVFANISWFFFGLEKFRLTVLFNSVIKVLSVAGIFIFVNQAADLWIYTLILALSLLVSNVILFIQLPKYIDFVLPSLHDIIRHFKPNVILFVPAIAFSVNNLLDKTMLGLLSDYQNTGYYYNVERLIKAPQGLIIGVGVVMMPRLASMISSGNHKESMTYLNRSLLLVVGVAIGMSFGIAAVAKDFIPLFFGDAFQPAISITVVMSTILIFGAHGDVMRMQYLIPNEMDKEYAIAAGASAFANLIFNYLLIPTMGAMGATIGTIIAEFTLCIVQVVRVKDRAQIVRASIKALFFVPGGFMTFGVVRLLSASLTTLGPILSVSVQAIAGAVVYLLFSAVLLYYLDRPLMTRLLKYTKR